MTSFDTSPYVWSNMTVPTSGITEIVLTSDDGDEVNVENLMEPVDIFIPQPPPGEDIQSLVINIPRNQSASIHVNVTEGETTLLATGRITDGLASCGQSPLLSVILLEPNHRHTAGVTFTEIAHSSVYLR